LRAGGVSTSPLGVLVHPIYGPWFAYRGALAFGEAIEAPPVQHADPCGTCRDKPCIAACPVGAISQSGAYDVGACRDHVSSADNACYALGCLARHACPLGADFVYPPAQAGFHMRAFARRR
jgi:Fe-S-cluster-containing hydrogenase component 2